MRAGDRGSPIGQSACGLTVSLQDLKKGPGEMADVKLPGYNVRGYVVSLSEEAFIQVCLSGLEAYVVRHQTSSGKLNMLETYGLLWGNEVTQSDGRTLYHVRFVTTDTSATRTQDSCTPRISSLELKRDTMTSFWPQHDFLGNFHTHPYNCSYLSVRKSRLYQFSSEDYNWLEGNDYWRDHGLRVGLATTITYMTKKGWSAPQWMPGESSAIEFTLGNYRIWLKAYIAYSDDTGLKVSQDNDENVLLDCPSVLGLTGEFTRFGKAVIAHGRLKHQSGVL